MRSVRINSLGSVSADFSADAEPETLRQFVRAMIGSPSGPAHPEGVSSICPLPHRNFDASGEEFQKTCIYLIGLEFSAPAGHRPWALVARGVVNGPNRETHYPPAPARGLSSAANRPTPLRGPFQRKTAESSRRPDAKCRPPAQVRPRSLHARRAGSRAP